MKRSLLALIGLGLLMCGALTLSKPAAAQVNCTGVAAWSPNSVAYAVGNLVTYNGSEYKCLQAHTSQAAWDPADAASLWQLQGTCSSTTGTTTGATCTATPPAPTALAASNTTQTGTTLSWTAPTAPANCTITGYTIFKSGASIGTSTTTSFNVTGLTANTQYTFTVAATDSAGTGAQSSSVTVTTQAASTGGLIKIACGNSAVSPFVADVDFSGGAVSSGTTTAISTAGVTNPAPAAVYQHGRKSNCTYTIPGLTAGTTYQVRLHFAEYAATAAGQRTFNVSINGTQVLTNFDIFATAGGEFKANIQQFNAVANSSGQIVIVFTTVVNNVLVSGIEVNAVTVSCTTKPGTPGGLAASGTTSNSTNLTWNSVSAPANCNISGYAVYKGGTQIATVSSGTSYTATGLSPSTAYTFTVAAIDGAGTGTQSTAVNVTTQAQSTAKGKVIGYWESWAALPLLSAAANYDICEIAFAQSTGTNGATQTWPATTESSTQIASDITTLHGQGKKVLISVGGANTFTMKLMTSTDESNFVSSVESIVDTWHLDGVDLDLENNQLAQNAGDTDINNPTTPTTVNMIAALAALKAHYGSSFMITMAPQVADINCAGHQIGNDGAGLYWGQIIPLINKARGNITYVMTQFYNASDMYAKDGVSIYHQATPDFDVAMADLLLSGYTMFGTKQAFPAISANQVVIGTPAVPAAAGSGYNTPTGVDQVVNYIKAGTSFGGAYHLSTTYPSLGGVMTWDMNYDNAAGYPMAGAVAADVHK